MKPRLRPKRRKPKKKKQRYAGITFTNRVDNSPAGRKAEAIEMAKITGFVNLCHPCFDEYYFGVYLEDYQGGIGILHPSGKCAMCGKAREVCVRATRSAK